MFNLITSMVVSSVGAGVEAEEGGEAMNNAFYEALLAIIIIPYSLLFLMQLWNMIGPSIRMRRNPDAE